MLGGCSPTRRRVPPDPEPAPFWASPKRWATWPSLRPGSGSPSTACPRYVPVAWFNSIDPLVSMAAVPFLLAYWQSQASRGREPSEVGKIGIGAWMASAANLLLVLGCVLWHRVPLWVPFLYDTVLGLAFLYYWPPLLALVSREAPPRLRATLMGGVFLSLFFANLAIGWLGSLYERMTPAQFWALHAGISAAGGLLVVVLQRPLARVFGDRERLQTLPSTVS
jgi:proton-dependent oligopeptide transporter, POT family